MSTTLSMLITPVLVAIAVWWFSTGLVFSLVARGSRSSSSSGSTQPSMTGTTVVTLGAVAGLLLTRADASVAGVYVAFTCALVIWGWHEMSFLFGHVTGPRQGSCPADATGWRRFRYAVAVLIHHELAIAWTLMAVSWLSWSAPNKVALYTLALLWVMRVSAKLNLFLGVPHFSDEMLPDRLSHLRSYFGRKHLNPLLPLSILGGVLLTTVLFWQAGQAPPVAATSLALLGSMAALGTLEHLFLALPFKDAALWQWLAPGSRTPPPAAPSPTHGGSSS